MNIKYTREHTNTGMTIVDLPTMSLATYDDVQGVEILGLGNWRFSRDLLTKIFFLLHEDELGSF